MKFFIKRIKEKENLNIFIYFDEEKILNKIKDLEKKFNKREFKWNTSWHKGSFLYFKHANNSRFENS